MKQKKKRGLKEQEIIKECGIPYKHDNEILQIINRLKVWFTSIGEERVFFHPLRAPKQI